MIIHVKGDVIEIKGSLVANHWAALKSVVSLLLDQHPNGAIIDGSKLTEINESGAKTFLDASAYIQAHNARVMVAGLPEQILKEIRHMPGARSQLPLAASIEEARASLAVGGAEAVPESRRKPAILVPLLGDWRNAIEIAVAQAGRKAEIHLLYVIEVPRAMPLGVPLPDKEHEATKALDEAEQALRRRRVTIRRLTTRARTSIEGVAKFAAESQHRLVVIAYAKEELEREFSRPEIMDTLCDETPSNLAILCTGTGEDTTPARSKSAIIVPLTGAWPSALEFAAEQAAAGISELHLLYVIQIPRTLAMEAILPDEERAAQITLTEAERFLKRRRGLTVRRFTTRARDVTDGIAKFAAAAKPRLLVVGYIKNELSGKGVRYTAFSTLCHESTCDVAMYCVTE